MAPRAKLKATPAAVPERVMTHQDYLDLYHRAVQEVVSYWKESIEKQRRNAADLALRVAVLGGVSDVMRWGVGLEDEIAALYANEALGALVAGYRDVQGIVEYQLREIERAQRNNSYHQGSSSLFANAVMGARSEVARSYAEKCRYWRDAIREYRAMAEVL